MPLTPPTDDVPVAPDCASFRWFRQLELMPLERLSSVVRAAGTGYGAAGRASFGA